MINFGMKKNENIICQSLLSLTFYAKALFSSVLSCSEAWLHTSTAPCMKMALSTSVEIKLNPVTARAVTILTTRRGFERLSHRSLFTILSEPTACHLSRALVGQGWHFEFILRILCPFNHILCCPVAVIIPLASSIIFY